MKVTQEVIDQVGAKLQRLGYAVTAYRDPGTFLVTMIEQESLVTEAVDDLGGQQVGVSGSGKASPEDGAAD